MNDSHLSIYLLQGTPGFCFNPIPPKMAEQTYYIDEDVGEDVASQAGTEASPYKSLGFAVLQHGDSHQFLTRKSTTRTVPAGSDSSVKLEWKPTAKAALKKAKNYVQRQQKKAAREQELVAQRTKEEADRKKIPEEAKKIVIEEDMSLPKVERIKLDVTDLRKSSLEMAPTSGEQEYGSLEEYIGRGDRRRPCSSYYAMAMGSYTPSSQDREQRPMMP